MRCRPAYEPNPSSRQSPDVQCTLYIVNRRPVKLRLTRSLVERNLRKLLQTYGEAYRLFGDAQAAQVLANTSPEKRVRRLVETLQAEADWATDRAVEIERRIQRVLSGQERRSAYGARTRTLILELSRDVKDARAFYRKLWRTEVKKAAARGAEKLMPRMMEARASDRSARRSARPPAPRSSRRSRR